MKLKLKLFFHGFSAKFMASSKRCFDQKYFAQNNRKMIRILTDVYMMDVKRAKKKFKKIFILTIWNYYYFYVCVYLFTIIFFLHFHSFKLIHQIRDFSFIIIIIIIILFKYFELKRKTTKHFTILSFS